MERPEKLTLYKASAGSGKTYTLTREYLRHVLRPGVQPRHILAITFTNAATADMKRKIMESLAAVAEGTYPDWLELLTPQEKKRLSAQPDFGDEAARTIRKRASAALQTLLHRYQDFSVKTIDSFVQNLIKPFAFELGLPQNYTPNLEIEELSAEITERLIDECGRPGMEIQTGFLSEFLQNRSENERSLNLNEPIQKVVGLLFSEASFEALEHMQAISSQDFRLIIDRIRKYGKKTESEVADRLEAGRKIVREAHLEAADFYEGSRGLYAWFGSADTPLRKIAEPGASVRKCVEKGILKKDAESDTAQKLHECYQALTDIDFATYRLLSEINNSIYSLALVNRANEILDDIKETTSVIPISEFNKRIDKALSTENNDFIFERSGSRYHHVFIDEFQDTSRLQWKNLKPIVENNIAQGNECLLVGDPKQSIYRFRNADLEQFTDLCEGRSDIPLHVETLKSNWRSEPGIIAFNNLFYRFIQENYAFSSGLPAGDSEAGTQNLARIVFKEHEQFYQGETGHLPLPDPQAVRIYLAQNMGGEPLTQWYLEQTLSIVNRFDPGDVTVLCRKNAHCKLVADYLVAQGIKVSTPDSLILGSHEGLKLLIASLRYIDNRASFHRAEIFFLARRLGLWQNTSLLEIPDDYFGEWKSAGLAARFAELLRIGQRQADLYDTVEALIRFWKMERFADQYILSFLDIVQGERFARIADLLDWWDSRAGKTPVCPTRTGDSVQIMSIHKSKGLEFKIVVMPFISDSKLHSDTLFWTEPNRLPADLGLPTALVRYVSPIAGSFTGKAMARENQLIEIDNLNALYVATTRPRERLFLLCNVPGRSGEKFSSADAIARFAEANPEYLEKTEDGSVLEISPEAEAEADTGNGSLCEEPVREKAAIRTPADESECPLFLSFSWRERYTSAALPLEHRSPEIDWGNFMHAALARIEIADRETIVRCVEQASNDYPQFASRREEAAGRIESLLTDPQLRPCFSGEYMAKTETGIAVAADRIYIPDRVLLKDRSAVVLDYKTGESRPDYATQIANYMTILKQMGFSDCKGFLVYLGREIRIEEISASSACPIDII